MPVKNHIPSYRHHRSSGQAIVTINGKDLYLGKYKLPESRTEYQRVINEWLTRHRTHPVAEPQDGLTIAEVVLAYLDFAKTYYRDVDGIPT